MASADDNGVLKKQTDNERTKVDVFGLPNLLRVRQDKTLIDINEILSQIRHGTA